MSIVCIYISFWNSNAIVWRETWAHNLQLLKFYSIHMENGIVKFMLAKQYSSNTQNAKRSQRNTCITYHSYVQKSNELNVLTGSWKIRIIIITYAQSSSLKRIHNHFCALLYIQFDSPIKWTKSCCSLAMHCENCWRPTAIN